MARVTFTRNVQRHVASPSMTAKGGTVRDVLEEVFSSNAGVKSYVLDERGEVRRHMVIFVDGRPIRDRARQTDPVREDSEVHIMQALSGG